MGFNRRYVSKELCLTALNSNTIKQFFGKADAIIFEDCFSSKVYELFKDGKSDTEILNIINQNMEEKTYEVY